MMPDFPASPGDPRRLVTAPSGPMKMGRRAGSPIHRATMKCPSSWTRMSTTIPTAKAGPKNSV
jgi:hypothetical protein